MGLPRILNITLLQCLGQPRWNEQKLSMKANKPTVAASRAILYFHNTVGDICVGSKAVLCV